MARRMASIPASRCCCSRIRSLMTSLSERYCPLATWAFSHSLWVSVIEMLLFGIVLPPIRTYLAPKWHLFGSIMHHIGDLFNRSGAQLTPFGRCGNGIGSLYGLPGCSAGGRRLRNARGGSFRSARPSHSIGHVCLGEAQLGQLGAHGACASDPHGSQHDAAVFSGHFKVLRILEIGQDRFRQSHPVLDVSLASMTITFVRKQGIIELFYRSFQYSSQSSCKYPRIR